MKKKTIWITVSAATVLIAVIGGIVLGLFFHYNDKAALFDNPPEMKLIYNKSASEMKLLPDMKGGSVTDEGNVFQQTVLPIGNGDLGASVFGDTDIDRLVINEKTLWSGGIASGGGDNFGNIHGTGQDGRSMSDIFYEVQRLLAEGRTAEADAEFAGLSGDGTVYGNYLCWGNLYLGFGHKKTKDYMRELDIEKALSKVKYSYDGTGYERTYFASNPDKVLVIKLSADKQGALSFDASFPSMQDVTPYSSGNTITHDGVLSDNGLLFYSNITVDTRGGEVTANADGSLSVSGATEAVLVLSAETDYKNEFPYYRSGLSREALRTKVDERVNAALEKGYDALFKSHTEDYSVLFDRVRLNLGGERPDKTTDSLLSEYNSTFIKNSEKLYLEQLLFQYGRYLLIASSRADSKLPANLQGLWNDNNTPPWHSDYHINVNLQMNYWPAYNTNLAECSEPLVDFVDKLREPGRITSKVYSGTAAEAAAGLSDEEYGFLAHTECTPFGFTAPGEGYFQKAQWSPAGVAWLLQNVYERYEYTMDIDYLRRIYPIMREAVRYFDRTMVETAGGRLVSSPTYSPEHGPLTEGNTYEQSLIWQLYNDTVLAAETLGEDPAKVAKWKLRIEKLNPIEIGADGQIKEWYHETTIGSVEGFEKGHRHVSNLLGLFPGDLIVRGADDGYLEAAVKSLENRGNGGTGWAMGHKLNLWARAGRGDKAYELIKNLLKKGTYKNLWDAHPPFQIDGNFGYTAGVAEMLVQSNSGYIELLPALPSFWSQQGRVSGLMARGGFEISVEWRNGLIDKYTIISHAGAPCKIKLPGGTVQEVKLEKGESESFSVHY